MKSVLKKIASAKILSSLFVLGLILLFNFVIQPDFFDIKVLCSTCPEEAVDFSCIYHGGRLFGQLIDIMNRSIPYMLLAFGMTLVIATGGVDISVGGVMAISGCLALRLIRGNEITPNAESATPLFLVFFLPLVVSVICGLWNGILISKLKMQPVIATLVLMVAGRGIANVIVESKSLTTKYTPYGVYGQGFLVGLPVAIFVALAVFLLFWFVSRKTAAGLFIESIGINYSAAKYSGIKSDLIIILIYGLSGLCAGLSGLLYTSNLLYANSNQIGLNYELDAILAVVIGGTSMTGGKFYLGGSLVGALILMALTKTIYSFNVAPEYTMVIKAAVVVVIVLIQSPVVKKFVSSIFRLKKKEVVISE